MPFGERDAWCDRVLGLGPPPADGPLPPGAVPYLPCGVDALLEVVDRAAITAADVVVDLGAGVGRALALLARLTGAGVIGVELQPALAAAALPGVTIVCADAADTVPPGTVYFLYCPFGGARLGRVLDALAAIARTRPIRIACVDLPLPDCPWLELVSDGAATVYRSR